MKRLPLDIQTLCAGLVQALDGAGGHGTIYEQHGHFYAVSRQAGKRVNRHLGNKDDPAAQAQASAIKVHAEQARSRRATIRMLRAGGLTGPGQRIGAILEAFSRLGLFEPQRLVLIGTLAAGVYPGMLGAAFPAGMLATHDIDLGVVSLAAFGRNNFEPLHLPAALHAVDENIAPIASAGLPHKFRGSDGVEIEFLSPARRGGLTSAAIPQLGISAETLPYMDYLIADAVPAALLHGSGVFVRVPHPARYAVHKLIVAQKRPIGEAKRGKDLEQARELMEALEALAPDELADALDDARSRGKKWREPIEASLKLLGKPAPAKVFQPPKPPKSM